MQVLPTTSAAPAAAVPGTERLLLIAACLLPFCSVARFPPQAAFWGEWCAVLLFSGWLTVRLWRRAGARDASRMTPWVALGWAALAVLTLAQVALHRVDFPLQALLAAVILMLAAVTCAASVTSVRSGQQAGLLTTVATALLAALLANAVFVVLGWAGIGILALRFIEIPVPTRALGLIGQANQLGTLAVLSFLAACHLRTTGRLNTLAFGALVLVAAIVCAASGSRIALVEWMLALGVVWRHRQSLQLALRKPSVQQEFLGAVIAFGVIQLAWVALAHGISEEAISVARTGSAGRPELLRDSVLLWLQHPVLGVGYGNYAGARLFDLEGSLPVPHCDHAHNLFAQALAEWGFTGFAIVVAMTVLAFRSLWQRPLVDSALDHAWTATFVLCILAHSMVEFPLWAPNFLLPFAVMAGILTSRSGFSRNTVVRWRRPAVALVAVAVLTACAGAAADYARSQRLALQMGEKLRVGPGPTVGLPAAETMRVAAGTAFPAAAEIMQVRAFELNSDFAAFKLASATRALRLVPSAETVARYAVFAALAGEPGKGQLMLDSMKRRNPAVYDGAREIMSVFAPADPAIAAIVAANPVGVRAQ